jgi:ribosome-associated protein
MKKQTFTIPEKQLQWRFIRASGPGGQHVNKTSTAVQLHFDVVATDLLTDAAKQRLYHIAGNRINNQGELVITVQASRSQLANREQALQQLQKWLQRAVQQPKKRHKTRVPLAEIMKNKQAKQQHSLKKQTRSKKNFDDH